MIINMIMAINNSKGIPEYASVDCVVIKDGKVPIPESEEFKTIATNMLFAIWAPIAVSRPFSPKTIIPSINPSIIADITIEILVVMLVPLKKCMLPNIMVVSINGMTGFLKIILIPCIRYPLKNISSNDA